MDQEVSKTLGELELKLRELERELASIGAGSRASQSAGGRIVDEAIETPAAAHPPAFEPREAIEQRFSLEARETVYGEIPATRDRRETIDMDELVRFGETLKRTFGDLIDRYTSLLAGESSQAPESHTESHS